MKRFLIALSILVLVALPASAAPKLNPEMEGCPHVGAPVINVKQTVVNTVDSGEGGNYWAFDDLSRQIRVWQTGEDSFCAEVNYEGQFDAQAGEQSPGNNCELDGSEDGTFQGGYVGNVIGELMDDPDWKTHGSVGTTDYNCDIDGNCPGAINWLDQYFESGYAFAYQWWGWIYHHAGNEWVNSQDGNSGDVTSCDP